MLPKQIPVLANKNKTLMRKYWGWGLEFLICTKLVQAKPKAVHCSIAGLPTCLKREIISREFRQKSKL